MSQLQERPRLLLIGAVPPPFVGPYLATERLLSSRQLRETFEVDFLDVSDHRNTSNIGALDWGNLALGLRHWFQFWARLASRRPDCVYLGISQGTWGFLRDLGFLLPALGSRRPVVVHLRGSEFGTFYRTMPAWLRSITRWVFRRIARCIVLAECLKPVMSGLVPQERIVAIPNGLNLADFDTAGGRSTTPGGGKRLLFLSHLMKRKGIFETIKALALVRREVADATLTVAGAWQNPEDRAVGEGLVRDLGLNGSVRFAGVVTGPDKVRCYREHDVFVFPPIEPEGLPWVILEAMAAGLPVVSTDQGAIREVVEQGASGFIVAPQPEAIAEKICLLLRDPGRALAMGAQGRHRVEACFSERVYVEAIVGVLRQAAETR